jgi:hypothetical protein
MNAKLIKKVCNLGNVISWLIWLLAKISWPGAPLWLGISILIIAGIFVVISIVVNLVVWYK